MDVQYTIEHSSIQLRYLRRQMFEEYNYSTSSYSHSTCPKKSTKTRSNRSYHNRSLKGSNDYQSKLKFKTQTCKYWSNQVQCPYGQNCNFAHGDYEMRVKNFVPTKYKTKLCQKFSEEGYCPYGNRCQFIHPCTSSISDKHQVAFNCLKEASDLFFSFLEETEVNSGHSRRLNFFQGLTEEGKGTQKDSVIEKIVEEELQQEYSNYVDVRSRHNSF